VHISPFRKLVSNFNQLLLLRTFDDPSLLTWMQRKAKKYTSPEIQNDLKIMAWFVTRDIAATVASSGFYTLMADKVANTTGCYVSLKC